MRSLEHGAVAALKGDRDAQKTLAGRLILLHVHIPIANDFVMFG